MMPSLLATVLVLAFCTAEAIGSDEKQTPNRRLDRTKPDSYSPRPSISPKAAVSIIKCCPKGPSFASSPRTLPLSIMDAVDTAFRTSGPVGPLDRAGVGC